MNIPFSLFLDIFVAVLLVVTIVYAVTLNNRLGTLRRDKQELQKLALSFGDATVRAEESTGQLRATIDVLQEQIKKAESLREDLVFLVERGNGTADTLEELVRAARDSVGVNSQPEPGKPTSARTASAPASRPAPMADAADRPAGERPATEQSGTDQMSDAERELLKALRSAG